MPEILLLDTPPLKLSGTAIQRAPQLLAATVSRALCALALALL